MAINKYMCAVLRALSYKDINVKKNYMLVREANKIMHTSPTAEKNSIEIDVKYDDLTVPCRLFTPNNKIEDLPVILFAHGGGWVHGDIETYARVCHDLSKKLGQMVLGIDYRLAPEFPFPNGFNDCYAVAKALFNGEILDVAPDDITLMGDSAGGNLMAAVSLRARDEQEFCVKRQILLYPACGSDHNKDTSPYESIRTNGKGFLLTSKRVCDYMDLYSSSFSDRTNPYFAPLAEIDLSSQPDTLIITAEFDPLRDEGEAYGKRLRADGNYVKIYRMKDALHGFFNLPQRFTHVQDCYKCIINFLSEVK